jgi:hypothetical protein
LKVPAHVGRTGLALLAVFSACSLAVDASDIDRGCSEGQKACGEGLCVPLGDPAYGCRADSCEPCELSNAIPRCNGQACVVDACLEGFGCPGPGGCQTNLLFDRNHCGACGRACHAPCRDGACVASECDPTFGDCDGEAENGCETSLATASNCGACEAACDSDMACEDGGCVPSDD